MALIAVSGGTHWYLLNFVFTFALGLYISARLLVRFKVLKHKIKYTETVLPALTVLFTTYLFYSFTKITGLIAYVIAVAVLPKLLYKLEWKKGLLLSLLWITLGFVIGLVLGVTIGVVVDLIIGLPSALTI